MSARYREAAATPGPGTAPCTIITMTSRPVSSRKGCSQARRHQVPVPKRHPSPAKPTTKEPITSGWPAPAATPRRFRYEPGEEDQRHQAKPRSRGHPVRTPRSDDSGTVAYACSADAWKTAASAQRTPSIADSRSGYPSTSLSTDTAAAVKTRRHHDEHHHRAELDERIGRLAPGLREHEHPQPRRRRIPPAG